MDILSIIGLILGIAAIILGQYLEGGHISTLINGPAMLIVMGGTFGAVMLQSPFSTFMRAMRILFWTFITPRDNSDEVIDKIVNWSNIARKEGLLGLENIEESEDDPFARKGLQLLIDGSEPESIRSIMHVDISTKEHFDTQVAKVFESMGGSSPTIGLLGAVMKTVKME